MAKGGEDSARALLQRACYFSSSVSPSDVMLIFCSCMWKGISPAGEENEVLFAGLETRVVRSSSALDHHFKEAVPQQHRYGGFHLANLSCFLPCWKCKKATYQKAACKEMPQLRGLIHGQATSQKQFEQSSDEVVERECCLVLRELGVEPARFILCNIPDSVQSGAGWLYLPMFQFLYHIIPCTNDDFYYDFWQLTLIHIVKDSH